MIQMLQYLLIIHKYQQNQKNHTIKMVILQI